MLTSIYTWTVLFVTSATYADVSQTGRKNILFLMSDDMRPQLGAYLGPDFPSKIHPPMHTPSLDALAARSLVLKRAYVQQALCSPSRTSMLTGRRPDTTHVTDLEHYFRTYGGNFTTIPQYFKNNGYHTEGIGKIFHPGMLASGGDDPVSWSAPYYHGKVTWENGDAWRSVADEKLVSEPLIDQQLLKRGLQRLKILAKESQEQPFFLAIGFHRPHLPFVAPQSFYDLYPMEKIRVPDNEYAPVGMPEIAWQNYRYLRSFRNIHALGSLGNINETFPAHVVRELRRAYYASLSYTDSLVGEILKELDTLGLSNDTIVSFCGDHGWQLGEHGLYGKHSNFELATHAPMMVRVPGLTDHGVHTERATEFVDLFPTLVEAAGFSPLPLCPPGNESNKVTLCREGTSVLPLIQDPRREWKSAVFSQYPRCGWAGESVMGYTMRTDRYRYTAWVYYSRWPNYRPISWNLYYDSEELYDHKTDPDENINLAVLKEYKKLAADLKTQLIQGWRAAQPKSLS